MKKVLFVLTNHKELGTTGQSTGFFLSEASHPYKVFKDAGFEVDFVSPIGGKPPIDGEDLADPINKAFLEDRYVKEKLENTMKPTDIQYRDYEAIFYVGGHGAMWDLPDNVSLATITAIMYESNKVIAAVCHGPAGLVNVALSNGQYLIKNRRLTAFSNEEEVSRGLDKVVPFLLENKLRTHGAIYSSDHKFQEHVVVDGRLVTGQNPASAQKVAEEVVNIINR